MDSSTLRKTFIEFFRERGHSVVPSSSLVPDDPTLLFTTAGMVQFKAYFEGVKEPPFPLPRATSVQKCLRAVDLEEVGKDARHLSFFEMLGNFSFGDYFKKEAIAWSWEFVTERLGLEPKRLWATVHTSDDEAAQIWEKQIGLSRDRVLRTPEDFWDMGVAGPCGPCSHLYYDRGEQYGAATNGRGFDEDRYFEIWNLVFIQNLMDDRLEVVGDLPSRNVDTGMGLERTAAALQGVPTVFDIDTMASIMRVAEEVLGKKYGEDPSVDVSLRVLTEHARGVTFAISDGILPSNEDRGYVLRRLIRRAIRYARLTGVDEPVLLPLAETTAELFQEAYPEVGRNREHLRRVVEREEARFDQTLRQGLGTLEEEIARAKASGHQKLSGAVAFKLHDTYGFPLDLTKDIAAEEDLTVDTGEFESLMKAQRERGREARKVTLGGEVSATGELPVELIPVGSPTEFLGYQTLEAEAGLIGVISGAGRVGMLHEGEEGAVILDRTPFYAEGGGQIGDRGQIQTPSGTFHVEDTQWGRPGLIVHRGRVTSGEIGAASDAFASVDRGHREGVRQSHTATHMVHWALRNFLGEHARQQGSLVEPGRLRFDFSHFEAVGDDRLAELEEEVNRKVLYDDSVRAFETTYEFAMSIGAMALFGEKYGDFVRVVEVGEYSKELCGGTHVVHTGQIGVVKLTSEASVGAGLRRVEAYTGLAGLKFLNAQAQRLKRVAGMLKVDPDRVEEKLQRVLETSRDLETRLSRQRALDQKEEVRQILSSNAVIRVGTAKLVPLRLDREVEEIRRLARAVRDELGSGAVVIGSARDGAANLVAAISSDLVEKGVSARELLSPGAALLGGRAGGGADMATAGGPKGSEIEKAMAVVEESLRSALEA